MGGGGCFSAAGPSAYQCRADVGPKALDDRYGETVPYLGASVTTTPPHPTPTFSPLMKTTGSVPLPRSSLPHRALWDRFLRDSETPAGEEQALPNHHKKRVVGFTTSGSWTGTDWSVICN